MVAALLSLSVLSGGTVQGLGDDILLSDDFAGDTLDVTKWNSFVSGGGGVSVSDGKARLSHSAAVSMAHVFSTVTLYRPVSVTFRATFGPPQERSYEWMGFADNPTTAMHISKLGDSASFHQETESLDPDVGIIAYTANDVVSHESEGTLSFGAHYGDATYRIYRVVWLEDEVKYYVDDVLVADHFTTIPQDEPLTVFFAANTHPDFAGTGSKEIAVDWVEVRGTRGPITARLDIEPGSDSNPINLAKEGVVPVAILHSSDLDPLIEVDEETLTFGRTGTEASPIRCSPEGEDVDQDGALDLVCHFETGQTGFQVGDTAGILRGHTLTGVPIEGRDVVRIIG